MYARGPERSSKPGTLVDLFFDSTRKFNKPDALQWRKDATWHVMSHAELMDRVRRLAIALQALGVRRGDRVATLAENRPEWAIADWACLMLGAADVPIYPTLPAEQIPYLLNDSGAVVVMVSNAMQAEKIASIRDQAPGVQHVIAFDADARPFVDHLLPDIMANGAALDTPDRAAQYEAAARAVTPGDLATIIYTSGTTGAPKGVMLSHDNFYSNVSATCGILEMVGTDVALSFLPLSHVFERTGDYLFFVTGTSIAYVESFDLVPIAMAEVRPTIAMSVPRLYEKMYARVFENALAGGAEVEACYARQSDGSELWSQIDYQVSEGNSFSVRAYTSDAEQSSHDLVLHVLSTIAFMPPAQAQSGANSANPASQYCVDQGGTLVIEEGGAGGQIGVCYFEDNRQCEEWALMNGDCPIGGVKVTGYTTPAARYCAITGGEYAITGNSGATDEQGRCTFKNGAVCDAWEYYNGACDPDQAAMPTRRTPTWRAAGLRAAGPSRGGSRSSETALVHLSTSAPQTPGGPGLLTSAARSASVGSECLTDEQLAALREAVPGEAEPGLAEHLAGCGRCQSRALFGAVRRPGLRREPVALPSLGRTRILLAIVLLSMAAFFWTLRKLAGPPD